MPTRDSVNQLLSALGELLDRPGLVLDTEDLCGLGLLSEDDGALVGELELSFDAERARMALYATLPVAEVTEELMQTLLEANALYDGPGDDVLGMDSETPCVSIVRSVDDGADAQALAAELDDFAGSMISWWDIVSVDGIPEREPPPRVPPTLRA